MQAAEHLRYPAIKKFLEEQLDPEMQDLAMKLCLIFVCSRICELSSLEERREVIDTYAEDDGLLIGIRDEVKFGVQRLWKRRPPLQQRITDDRSRARSGAQGQCRVPAQRGMEFI
jgi:hypothetical protein